jgi:hypothetical protein
MGLDVYLKRNNETVELVPQSDPGHVFRVGYFRSSYNGSGFNSVMERCGCPDLYAIFQPPQDAYQFKPNWHEAKVRAESALDQYRMHLKSPAGGHYVTFISASAKCASEREALAAFASEAEKERPFEAYSNSSGHFWVKGAKLKAAIAGEQKWSGPGVFLVFEQERVEGERDWYETALMIVIETIEHVLASGATDDFTVIWSA